MTFSTLIWVAVVIAVFIAIGLPPLQDAWAYYRWERVPAHYNTEKQGFSYVYKGVTYYSPRIDFWVRGLNSEGQPNNVGSANYNETCYVSPGNPTKAVLNLDAHKRFDRAGHSLFLSGIAICVGIALSLVSKHRRKQATP